MKSAAQSDIGNITLMGMTPEELVMPFGLVLGSTRLKDLESTFVISCHQGVGFTKGPVVQVVQRHEEEPASECIVLGFDEAQVLDAAWFTISATEFDKAVMAYESIFELQDRNTPIKGSKSALFSYQHGQVVLNAPLFSQEMTVGYRTYKFEKAKMATAAEIFE